MCKQDEPGIPESGCRHYGATVVTCPDCLAEDSEAAASRYLDDPKPDGDHHAPGGIGCPLCDTLWATSASVERHLDVVHHTTYDDATSYEEAVR